MSATAEIKPVLVKISTLLSYVLCAAPVKAEERSDRPVEVGISVETFTPPGKDHRGYRLRLETLGYHIAVANPEKCEKHKMMTGLILHDLASYDVKDRGRVRIGNGATVMDVVPDLAASAGLQAGDEIVTIAGKDITSILIWWAPKAPQTGWKNRSRSGGGTPAMAVAKLPPCAKVAQWILRLPLNRVAGARWSMCQADR
jgi:hypothetical protein